MKLIRASLVFVVLILSSVSVYADGISTTLDVSATTCAGCFGFPNPSIDLQARFTVELVTDQFYNSGGAYLFTGTVDEVVAITGTLNGHPMTLISPPSGAGSWLYPGSYALGTVYFMADGLVSWLQNDNEYNLLEILDSNGDGYGTNNAINWSAVPASEPASFVLLAVGIIGIAFLKQRNLLLPDSWQSPNCNPFSLDVSYA